MSKDKDGYLMTSISINGIRTIFKVHRLVANAFISNEEDKSDVNHIDHNKSNNDADNLEWLTHEENIAKYVEFREAKGICKKINKCKCGNEIDKKATQCLECYRYSNRRVDRPDYQTLLNNVKEIGYKATGRLYGVSDNSIRKWLNK